MDKDTLLKYIMAKGYRTREEILSHFKSEDLEVIDIHLSASVDKGALRKMGYRTDSDIEKHGTIYVVPYHKEG